MTINFNENLKILIIEDNDEVQDLIKLAIDKSFKDDGLQTSLHIDFCETLELAKTHVDSVEYDLVFLDLNLPDSQGIGTCKAIKQIIPDKPIIVLTSNNTKESAIEAVQLGMQEYIPKQQIMTAPLSRIIFHSIDRFKLLNQKENLAREKAEFLAKISHEIRQPMNGIVGLANLMELATSESEKTEYLATIKSSCNMLLEIVNGVLDLSSIEAKKFHLVDEEFNLRVTIEEASKIFATAANDKRILLSELVDINCPKFVTGDALRLKQILTNLISNAVKHTNIGSVRILVKKDDKSENSITFSIEDTGLGISSEAQKELFKPYSQVSEHSIKAGGTGLGLVLVKELVEYMGGEINVESEPLKGCKFSFNIPFKSFRYDTPPRINLKGYQVLVISEFEMDHFLIKQIQNRSIDVVSQNILCQRDYELLEKSLQNNEYDAIVADFRLAPNHWMKSSNLVSYLKKIDKKILYLIPFGVNKIIPNEEHTISGPTHQSILYKHLAHFFGEQWKPSNTLLNQRSPLLSISALVVDDVELNRIVLTKFLESFGCQVEQAKSGNEAISLVKRKNIQIIFMDCVMPIMNGFETTKLLREYREFDSIPIIALTGDTSEETKELCTQVGMNGVITKPFSPDVVKDLIIKKCKIKF